MTNNATQFPVINLYDMKENTWPLWPTECPIIPFLLAYCKQCERNSTLSNPFRVFKHNVRVKKRDKRGFPCNALSYRAIQLEISRSTRVHMSPVRAPDHDWERRRRWAKIVETRRSLFLVSSPLPPVPLRLSGHLHHHRVYGLYILDEP